MDSEKFLPFFFAKFRVGKANGKRDILDHFLATLVLKFK